MGRIRQASEPAGCREEGSFAVEVDVEIGCMYESPRRPPCRMPCWPRVVEGVGKRVDSAGNDGPRSKPLRRTSYTSWEGKRFKKSQENPRKLTKTQVALGSGFAKLGSEKLKCAPGSRFAKLLIQTLSQSLNNAVPGVVVGRSMAMQMPNTKAPAISTATARVGRRWRRRRTVPE